MLGQRWLKPGLLGFALAVSCRLNYEPIESDTSPVTGGAFAAAGMAVGGNGAAASPSAGTSAGGVPPVAGGASEGGSTEGGSSEPGAGGAVSGDCVETNAGVEACDGLDNDCNGTVDDGDPCEPSCFASAQAGTGYMFCGVLTTLAEAAATCAQTGMTLIRIDDAAENEWVRATAFADPMVAASPFFVLGGSDATLEGDWRWPDGEAFWSGDRNGSAVGGLYTNWEGREPNDLGVGAEDCMGMGPDGTWSDIRCSGTGSEMPFGCERP